MRPLKVIAGIIAAIVGINFFVALADEYGSPVTIAETQCTDITAVTAGLELKNGFGATFKVIRIADLTETHRDQTTVECSAQIMMDNGTTGPFALKAENVGGELYYTITQTY